jgi:CBS-domain-containing membrane protein
VDAGKRGTGEEGENRSDEGYIPSRSEFTGVPTSRALKHTVSHHGADHGWRALSVRGAKTIIQRVGSLHTGVIRVAEKDLGKEFPSVLDSAYRESQRHRKIADIMTREVMTTTTDTLMDKAARIMGEKHIGSLVVKEFGTPVGIVTERDLLTKVLAGRMNLGETRVKEVMSYPLIKVCPAM